MLPPAERTVKVMPLHGRQDKTAMAGTSAPHRSVVDQILDSPSRMLASVLAAAVAAAAIVYLL